MWRSLGEGLFLGWGACIPLGPMNIEIIRRHLVYGFRFGFAFGLGASLSDLTYFFIVYLGFIQLLTDHAVFTWIGYVSIAVLLYFAISALCTKSEMPQTVPDVSIADKKKQSAWRHGVVGYGYALVNPYTIIFWVAVGAQLATLRSAGLGSVIALGVGIVLSTVSWVLGLNAVLHRIRQRISPRWMKRTNYIGAACLFAFVLLIAYELLVKGHF